MRLQPAGVLDHQDQRLDVSSPSPAPTRRSPSSAAACRGRSACSCCSTSSLQAADRVDQGRREQAAEDDGGGRRGRRRLGAAVRDLQLGLDREPEDGRQLADDPLRAVPPQRRAVRALVDLELTQAEQATAGPEPDHARDRRPRRPHASRDGDSLPSIAYRAYGDATRWRTIAEANGIDNPLRLRRGSPAHAPEARDLMPRHAEQHVAGFDDPGRRRRARRRASANASTRSRSSTTCGCPTCARRGRLQPTRRATPIDSHAVQDRRAARGPARRGRGRDHARRCSRARSSTLEPEFRPAASRMRRPRLRHVARAEARAQAAHVPEPDGLGHRQEGRRARPASAPSASRAATPHDFVPAEQRDRLGLHLAAGATHRLRVRRRATRTLDFRHADSATGAVELALAATTLHTFRPRVTGVQQVEEVNVRGSTPRPSRRSTATATSADAARRDRRSRARRSPATLGGGTTRDRRPRRSSHSGEADAIAQGDARPARQRATRGRGRRARQPAASRPARRSRSSGVGQQVLAAPTASPRRRTSTAAAAATRPTSRSRPLVAHARSTWPAARNRGTRGSALARGRRRDQQQRPRRAWAACA